MKKNENKEKSYKYFSLILLFTDTQRVPPVKSIGQDITTEQRQPGDPSKQEMPPMPLPVRTDIPPPPPQMIPGIPPPPLPNQVLPNMISISGSHAVLAGLQAFNAASQPLTHLPPPPPIPIVSTHLPPPTLLSPPHSGVTLSGIPLTNLVTADQVRACEPSSLYLTFARQVASLKWVLDN